MTNSPKHKKVPAKKGLLRTKAKRISSSSEKKVSGGLKGTKTPHRKHSH